jgi:hypothetical protein
VLRCREEVFISIMVVAALVLLVVVVLLCAQVRCTGAQEVIGTLMFYD